MYLVRGVGGGLRVVDRSREGGGEGGLSAVGDGHEGPVLVAILQRDDADEVGVVAVDVKSAHGVAASDRLGCGNNDESMLHMIKWRSGARHGEV